MCRFQKLMMEIALSHFDWRGSIDGFGDTSRETLLYSLYRHVSRNTQWIQLQLTFVLLVMNDHHYGGRDIIVVITFAVVAFSVFAQGLTITPLLRRLGEVK
jgi:hypothetical protein